MAKKIDIKTYSAEDLKVLVDKKREELRALRFSAEGSKNKNVKAARNLRKDVARALTQATTLKNK